MVRYAHRSLVHTGKGDDRVKVVELGENTVCAVLADGSGAVSGGRRAAELVVDKLSQKRPEDFGDLFDSILALDSQLKRDSQAGLSTVVSVYTMGLSFIGAVVGDSEALLIQDGKVSNLAPDKEIQPLVGDGEAFPTVFTGSLEGAIMLICSDGLSKYISAADVLSISSQLTDPVAIVDELINVIDLPEGELQDDVSVIVISGQ